MKKTAIFTLALALMVSCIPDGREQFLPEDSFGITARSAVTDASVHTGICSIGIAKNGKGLQEGTVYLDLDSKNYLPLLEAYNTTNGTAYKAVPASLVNFAQSRLHFSKEDVVKELSVTWDAGALATEIGDDTNYVIPVLLASDDLEVSSGRGFFLIHLNRSSVSVNQSIQARTIEKKKVEEPDAQLREEIILDLTVTNPIKGVGLSFPVALDPVAAKNYVPEDGTVYTAAPAGLVSLVSEKVDIPEGGLGSTFRIVVNKEVLLDGGALKDFPPYIAAVTVNGNAVKATMDGKDFDIKGLSFGNMTTVITIAPAQHGISVVVREWGLYSDSDPWYKNATGFTDGADRTVAMDKDYVYVSLSSASGGIYAFSRSSGAFEKTLNVSPAQGKGNVHAVSCVRTIKNEEGNDILTFCSLKEGENQSLNVFAYTNGTDKAPVQILSYNLDNKGGVNDWRRYGDRFTVCGTWQNGQLWFQTWSNGATAKTIGFNITNGVITNPKDPVDYYIANPKAGIKDVVWYPGWDNVLITENGKGTFFKPGAAGPNNWVAWTQVEVIEDLSLSYGYNFFNFHDQNYIAYVQLEGESAVRGRLLIMEDNAAAPSDFPAQLKAQSGLLQYPIQDAEDFEAKSSVYSASSVGDCAVYEVAGNTYIATLIQGCGLSLFRLQ